MKFPGWNGDRRSIRARVLTIALIPSAALLILGVGGSSYLIDQGSDEKTVAGAMQRTLAPGDAFVRQTLEERRLSMLWMGGDTQNSAGLPEQRPRLDDALKQISQSTAGLSDINSNLDQNAAGSLQAVATQMATLRRAIDARAIPAADVYAAYNQFSQSLGAGLQQRARDAPDAETAAAQAISGQLFNALDSMSRGNAFAAGAVAAGGLDSAGLREYREQVGAYHIGLTQVLPALTERGREMYGRLAASNAWRQLSSQENALLDRGPKPGNTADNRPLPLNMADWQNAAKAVTSDLAAMLNEQSKVAEQAAFTNGESTFNTSLLAGLAVLLISTAVFLIALRMANRLVGRMKRLRVETLELAVERLPRIVRRLRAGETIDPDIDVPRLNHGTDELGQVADAFNRAQQTAVMAAAQEAKTREGMNAVFLNIAHRSQMVVHRQLEVLDEAERRQQDPAHLELLFRLDHLATRARRNAENLVILGGQRPGRKWRKPVALDEIARSAVSETEHYARVNTVRLPDVSVDGGVVADLVHLLAELVDNATTFSPPDSRVEVRGNTVGRGVVVEIEDQGLGMTAEQRDEVNAMMHNPPDFQAMGVTSQMRLGLFVVAQLAVRQGISVTLAESAYGGIRAIVLIPSSLISDDQDPAEELLEVGSRGDDSSAVNGATIVHQRRQRLRPTPAPYESTAEWPVEPPRTDTRWPQEQPPSVPQQFETPRPEPAAWTDGQADNDSFRKPAQQRQVSGGRAPLPRRRKQTNMAPQLAADTTPVGPAPQQTDGTLGRTPEQARNSMSALLRGTRLGRQNPPPGSGL